LRPDKGLFGVQEAGNALHQATGDLALVHRRPVFDTGMGHDAHCVAVAAHDPAFGAYIIGDDPVGALSLQFDLSVLDEVLRLGREPDQQHGPEAVMMPDGRQNIRVFDERERRRGAGAVLLDFLVRIRF